MSNEPGRSVSGAADPEVPTARNQFSLLSQNHGRGDVRRIFQRSQLRWAWGERGSWPQPCSIARPGLFRVYERLSIIWCVRTLGHWRGGNERVTD